MVILTRTDQSILKQLVKNPEGINFKDLVLKTKEHTTTIHRRLQYLKKKGIIRNCRSFRCAIYSINRKSKLKFYFNVVECPKCQAVQSINDQQTTVTCINPGCLTPSKERVRFYITIKRIKRITNIIMERE